MIPLLYTELTTKTAKLFLDSSLGEQTEALKEGVAKIQQLQTLYELTDRFPVWPFDVQTLRRFFVALTSPFIPILIGLLVDSLKRIFNF